MLKKGEHVEGTPAELKILLTTDKGAKAFLKRFPYLINVAIAIG